MWGIAGYSFDETFDVDPLHAARILIATVAERGADAAGCAFLSDGRIEILKQPGGASSFIEHLHLEPHVRHALLHVRDFTKGTPSLMANNHPIRHGSVVGVHNGKISNDDDVFRLLGVARDEPGMTVDSEAIFAALHHAHDPKRALETLQGSLACGWLDASMPDRVFLARGYGRPLWIGKSLHGSAVMWASTLEALEIAEDLIGVSLHKRPMRPGSILQVKDGLIIASERFQPDASASWLMNPIASPHEREACLARIQTA